MRYGIRMVSSRDERFVFHENVWLKTFDADANDGAGGFEFTDDPEEALAFANSRDAVGEYTRISSVKPVLADGTINMPLREAFAISVAALPKREAAA